MDRFAVGGLLVLGRGVKALISRPGAG